MKLPPKNLVESRPFGLRLFPLPQDGSRDLRIKSDLGKNKIRKFVYLQRSKGEPPHCQCNASKRTRARILEKLRNQSVTSTKAT